MSQAQAVQAVFTSGSASGYQCTGAAFELFNNSNGNAVFNGGAEPSFSTGGQAYCLISISTYHWNNGAGATPGTIGLSSQQGTLGPWEATGSSGQGGAPNVNWTATPGSPTQPVIIDGTYNCVDSSPGTWSWNSDSSGYGFCAVHVEAASRG